ncbi:MAG: ABC transporter substrate-binding protein [Deltaproteobacteria bacterium]|nr:ABC transporter substrate-binding protein [Deltaproteobacteria bacterium]
MPRTTPKRPRLALILAALAALAAACGRRDGPRPAPAPRVVSIVPAATAVVVALGEADHLVGVTRYGHAPGVPVVGDTNPPPERVLAQEPDLVLVGDYPSQAPTREKLAALGVETLPLPFVTLADMRAATLTLGARLGATPEAEALVARLDAALAAGRARATERGPVKVLVVYGTEPGFVYTTAGGDHVSELLAAVGGVNVVHDGGLTVRLGLEAVLARAPELVLHVAPDAALPDDAAALAYWRQALPDLPAARRGQVRVWPDDHLAQNGPWLADAVAPLAALLDRAAAAR